MNTQPGPPPDRQADSPSWISEAGVAAAAATVAGHVRRTPMLSVELPDRRSVRLKLEALQVTGSFKPRGALHSLVCTGAPEVIACSGGNHGLAVAWAAQRLGRKATIVVPTSAAATKVRAMRATGADVVLHGDVPADAFALAESMVAERGLPLVHPYNQPLTIEGQATLGLELLTDAPDVTHWLVAVGGGGFPAGLSFALRGSSAQVIPVEPTGCPSLFAAQQAGRPVPTQSEGIARTSLGPPSLGDLPWEILRYGVPTCTLVTDTQIAAAQQWLWDAVRLVAEPGGATALAALLSGAWAVPPDSTVGVVVCGGNADALPA